jgi:hypothetical protein
MRCCRCGVAAGTGRAEKRSAFRRMPTFPVGLQLRWEATTALPRFPGPVTTFLTLFFRLFLRNLPSYFPTRERRTVHVHVKLFNKQCVQLVFGKLSADLPHAASRGNLRHGKHDRTAVGRDALVYMCCRSHNASRGYRRRELPATPIKCEHAPACCHTVVGRNFHGA